jgi:hypothetical protein
VRVATGHDTMDAREHEDGQGEDMQALPPFITDAWAEQGAQANRQAKIQANDAQGHPEWAIMTGKRKYDLAPAEVGKGIDPHGRNMNAQEGCAE